MSNYWRRITKIFTQERIPASRGETQPTPVPPCDGGRWRGSSRKWRKWRKWKGSCEHRNPAGNSAQAFAAGDPNRRGFVSRLRSARLRGRSAPPFASSLRLASGRDADDLRPLGAEEGVRQPHQNKKALAPGVRSLRIETLPRYGDLALRARRRSGSRNPTRIWTWCRRRRGSARRAVEDSEPPRPPARGRDGDLPLGHRRRFYSETHDEFRGEDDGNRVRVVQRFAQVPCRFEWSRRPIEEGDSHPSRIKEVCAGVRSPPFETQEYMHDLASDTPRRSGSSGSPSRIRKCARGGAVAARRAVEDSEPPRPPARGRDGDLPLGHRRRFYSETHEGRRVEFRGAGDGNRVRRVLIFAHVPCRFEGSRRG